MHKNTGYCTPQFEDNHVLVWKTQQYDKKGDEIS